MTWQVAETRTTQITSQTSLPMVSRMLIALGYALAGWRNRRRTRRALSLLDTRLLQDIGLSEASRDAEAAKPFWLP
ncbi:DUF1127 domain-containing protein [Xinfangfangia sp. D13-10-4-6]|uniref:DUF1127 domain-containing protein n=1 Tax=Pseudogemmobacter hezensis TaxID=2737662 RepID=UPI00155491A5|nr:DUF1127 domain-containing protein [Pseudogemmobacter hezensis]NPD13697.1 DUF1127 domain-containing protein [Pseudogemmobacter hezensis]